MRYNLATVDRGAADRASAGETPTSSLPSSPPDRPRRLDAGLGSGPGTAAGRRVPRPGCDGFQPAGARCARSRRCSKVFVLGGYLREQGRYSDGAPRRRAAVPGGARPRPARRRVPDRRRRPVGDDEQYAAAMALLANRVGVPARVVVGAVAAARRQGPRRGRARLGGAARRSTAAGGRCPRATFMSRTAAQGRDAPGRAAPRCRPRPQPQDSRTDRARDGRARGPARPGHSGTAGVMPRRALARRSSLLALVVPIAKARPPPACGAGADAARGPDGRGVDRAASTTPVTSASR